MNNPTFSILNNWTIENETLKGENEMLQETLIPEIVNNPELIERNNSLYSINYPNVIETPVFYYHQGERRTIENQRSLINPTTGNLYSIVSNRYKVMPYNESIEMIEEAITNNNEFGRFKRDIEFLNDGGRMLAKYRFIDHSIEIRKGDFVNPEIVLRRSYDCSWGFVLLFGAFRLVCSNGLTIGEKILEYIHKHTLGVNLDKLSESLKGTMDRFQLQSKQWEQWTERKTLPDDYERVMNTLDFGKRHTEEIENEIEISSDITLKDIRTKTLSYWNFFNLISQYITHKIPSPVRQQTFYDRMRNAFRK